MQRQFSLTANVPWATFVFFLNSTESLKIRFAWDADSFSVKEGTITHNVIVL